MKNARFWIYHRDGWVKLTVRPGNGLIICCFERDDEGFSYSHDYYDLTDDGAAVINTWSNGGRDCDGRHDRSGVLRCPVTQLAAVPVRMEMPLNDPAVFNGKPICRPDWQVLRPVTVRDEYAEAMNY